MDLAHDVVRLQSEMVCPQVLHANEVNNLRRRAIATAPGNGLHDRKLEFPLRVVGVGDAGHASKKSSYSYEGKMVLLMHDSMPIAEKEWLPGPEARLLGGFGHCLWFSARRSQRVSHSTSHAETLAVVGTSQVAQVIAARITELFSEKLIDGPVTAHSLLTLQEQNLTMLPCDHVTDCMDLFELVTNVKGLSSDKSQRLAVLALREDRITRRLRNFVHTPTATMLSDGLTKSGLFLRLMEFATTGIWNVELPTDAAVRVRQRVVARQYSEADLESLEW